MVFERGVPAFMPQLTELLLGSARMLHGTRQAGISARSAHYTRNAHMQVSFDVSLLVGAQHGVPAWTLLLLERACGCQAFAPVGALMCVLVL